MQPASPEPLRLPGARAGTNASERARARSDTGPLSQSARLFVCLAFFCSNLPAVLGGPRWLPGEASSLGRPGRRLRGMDSDQDPIAQKGVNCEHSTGVAREPHPIQ